MAKYIVSIPWHATVYVEVEADTKGQAEEKGLQDAWPSLCHQCTDGVEMGEFNEEAEIFTSEVE